MAYVDDPSRAMFLDLLPLSPNARALEIGCGLGQILCAMSPRVRSVNAIELSPGQAQFAAERCRQEGRDNVSVAAGGDDLLLPFADGSFDVVVLNHVFEWVRTPGEAEATVAAQRLLLSEMRRVLEPGGTLFLGTKNRFGLRLLLGGRDENAREIPFGNALPRAIASAVASGRPGIHGLLHSYPTLARMLREAGFAKVRSFWGAPDGRYPRRYVATDPDSVRNARRTPDFADAQGTTRLTRMLMPLVPASLVKFFTPGLTFVAHAGNDPGELT
jgi:SAM-dependent methyltransferase